MKKTFIELIKPGDAVDDLFVLSEKVMSRKKDGGSFISIMLTDRTGKLKGVIWDDVDQFSTSPVCGDFVHVRGSVSEYRGVPQLVIKSMIVHPSDAVQLADFLPATRRNVDAMMGRLLKLTDSIQTPEIKSLLYEFWGDEAFLVRFKSAPAAKRMHHAYLGGLLEHTLSLAILSDRVADHYTGIDRDLLMAGAMLHDIGKIEEFKYDVRIDYSDAGRLISHIVIGVGMVEKKISAMDNFPEKLALLLKHMVVSHHGQKELGSPETPKTLEAVLLNYLDEIDSKINGIREFMESQDANEDWTSYHRPLERFFYKGGLKSE